MTEPLLGRLRDLLIRQTCLGKTLYYRDVARALDLRPPGQIRQLATLLETLMAEDAARGKPFLAALVVGKPGLPRPGFFLRARALGRYGGPAEGQEAAAWHGLELHRLNPRKFAAPEPPDDPTSPGEA